MSGKYYIYSFEKLEVYKSALMLSITIKKLVILFPVSEKYDLSRQLKRSVSSIGSNISEGSGRASNFDQAHFTNIAYGSALESIHHLNEAKLLEYIDEDKYIELRMQLDKIINQLNALYQYQVNNKGNLKNKIKKKD